MGTPAGLRRWRFALVALVPILFGCVEDSSSIGSLEKVWGRVGISDGRLQKPRAMAIDPDDRLYIVDMTGRIQVFDADGGFRRAWKTPDVRNGRPTGLSFDDRRRRLLVADSHYHRVLIYSPEGELLGQIGGEQGRGPGQFDLVSDVVCDAEGNYYVSEYGDNARIQKFSPEGKWVLQWGAQGSEPGQFSRPQGLALDDEESLWVADSCNHRIQVFDRQGRLLKLWGKEGDGPGEFYYPYNLALGPDQTVYVIEYGNHRLQKLTRDGQSLGWWGTPGAGPGQLSSPWALARDSRGRIHVLDSLNHRVQRVRME